MLVGGVDVPREPQNVGPIAVALPVAGKACPELLRTADWGDTKLLSGVGARLGGQA